MTTTMRAPRDHSKVFSTWSYETDQPLALEALRETMRKLPGTVYRAKGVVYTTDAPQRRAVLQVVGRRVDISLQEEWGQRTPRTQIVAIGAAGGIDASLLEKTFASCIFGPVHAHVTTQRATIDAQPAASSNWQLRYLSARLQTVAVVALGSKGLIGSTILRDRLRPASSGHRMVRNGRRKAAGRRRQTMDAGTWVATPRRRPALP